jgi:hypothetical protein
LEDEPQLGSPSADVRWLTFAELADEMCPQYMSIGVPYHEYWHGDYTQLAHYREAFELQRERRNYDAWLQGAYFYDALCMASPLLHAFAKNGTKPTPYHERPYGAKASGSGAAADGKKQKKTDKEIQDIQALNASAKFASFMTQWNKRFESKGGEANGDNN